MSDVSSVMSPWVTISTSLLALLTGFCLGVYSIQGYIIPPAVVAERQHNLKDPLESEDSDIDEDDSILDHAPNWANSEEADRRQGLRASANKKNAQANGADICKVAPVQDSNEDCKLVLVVRTDLGMTKGKIGAQCGHATLACYKTIVRAASKDGASSEAQRLRRWDRFGQAKIAVQVKTEEELLQLMGKAHSLGVTAEVIADAGRTQIEAGSLTVLGVGPAPKSLVDSITGHLKLL